MRRHRHANGAMIALLMLILVGSNVFAPFRSSHGQVFLAGHQAPTHLAIVRTRAISRIAALPSQRALIAISRGRGKGGSPQPLPGFDPPPTDSPRPTAAAFVALPPPHLRC